MAKNKPQAYNLTATTTEQVANSKIFYGIKLIRNDSTTAKLYISFDEALDMANKNYIMIPAGGSVSNWDNVQIDRFYYKCDTGTADFVIWGDSSNAK